MSYKYLPKFVSIQHVQNQLKASFTIWYIEEKEINFFSEFSDTKQAQVQLSLVGVNAGIHMGLKLFKKC